jgi:hypothetical protein
MLPSVLQTAIGSSAANNSSASSTPAASTALNAGNQGATPARAASSNPPRQNDRTSNHARSHADNTSRSSLAGQRDLQMDAAARQGSESKRPGDVTRVAPQSAGIITVQRATASSTPSILLSPPNTASASSARPDPPTNTNSTQRSHEGGESLAELTEDNQRLRQQRLCRLCRQKPVDTIFLPCGHLCTCEACAATIRDCCLCHDRIRGTAKVFLK